jgi:hypothetical protein
MIHTTSATDEARSTETERREHVKAAIADSRIEGYPPPSRSEQAILDAYIRGEIEAKDLVEVYKRMVSGGDYASQT